MVEKLTISPFDAFNTFINILMGTGPILLPPAIAGSGIGLAALVLFIMYFLSQMAGEFVIEVIVFFLCQILAIINSIKLQYTDDSPEKPLALQNHLSLSSQGGLTEYFSDPTEVFALRETFEYGAMGQFLWGRKGQILNTTNIIIYLYGILISKGIITGNTLRQIYTVVCSTLFADVPVLNKYYFWVILFFLISGSLSFKNISAIAWVQTFIAIIRYLTILTMFIGAAIVIGYEGRLEIVAWDFSGFAGLFSAAVLAYMSHHSLPGILRPVNPSTAIKTILNTGFIFGGLIFLFVPMTGMMAFPGLKQYCYYNIVFDQSPVYFAYYIISFYIFLNIAALPVLTITMRMNMMRMCVPHMIPSNSYRITWPTILFTLLIILPCMTLAIGQLYIISAVLKEQIDFVVGITGGVCGVIIMMVLPAFMVVEARKKAPLSPALNPNRSIYFANIFAYLSILFAAIFLPYNLYLQVDKLVRQIDGTEAVCFQSFNATVTCYHNCTESTIGNSTLYY